MIGYITLGTNNLEEATVFYAQLLSPLGILQRYQGPRLSIFGTEGVDEPTLVIAKPFNEEIATPGNGSMTALPCGTQAKVSELYDLAISLGATDEGPPDWRYSTFYGAYVRDLDKNKLAFYFKKNK